MKLAIAAILASASLCAAAERPLWLPDPSRTPGSVRPVTAEEVCSHPITSGLRHWSRERDDRILEEYGLPPGPHPNFEVDHLIPLSLGGTDDGSNLWPQPRQTIVPYVYSAEAKDALEWELKDELCAGTITLPEAQYKISHDWIRE